MKLFVKLSSCELHVRWESLTTGTGDKSRSSLRNSKDLYSGQGLGPAASHRRCRTESSSSPSLTLKRNSTKLTRCWFRDKRLLTHQVRESSCRCKAWQRGWWWKSSRESPATSLSRPLHLMLMALPPFRLPWLHSICGSLWRKLCWSHYYCSPGSRDCHLKRHTSCLLELYLKMRTNFAS